MIPEQTISAIRQRADIVAVIGQAVKLVRRGRSHLGLCPFHKEKTPSFHVNQETGRYYCFGCHETGNVIDFIMKMEGLGFIDAVRALGERLGVEVNDVSTGRQTSGTVSQVRENKQQLYEVAQLAAVFFETQLREHRNCRVAREEIARRALEPSSPTDAKAYALQAFRVGYAPSEWDALVHHLRSQGVSPALAATLGLIVPRRTGDGYYDFFRNRLVFAIVDVHGRVVGFSARLLANPETGVMDSNAGKYINSPESPIYSKSNTVFGLFQARQQMRQKQFALLVEGNFDVVSLHARGICNVVAPLGTAFTEQQARRIRRFVPQVTLLFDSDSAGKKAIRASRSVCAVADIDVRVAVLPSGMDPDDYVRERGVESLQRLVTQGQSMLEYLIDETLQESFAVDSSQQKAALVRKVADIIREEKDPTVRAMAQQYADKVAGRLGVSDARTMVSIRKQVASATKPTNVATASRFVASSIAHRADRARQRLAMEMFGCVIEFPELLDDQQIDEAVKQVEGQIVHAFKLAKDISLADRGRWSDELLRQLDPSLHNFASKHLTAPSCESVQEARELFLNNAMKLKRLNIAREHTEALKEAYELRYDADRKQHEDLLLQAVNRHKKRLGL